MGDEKHSSQPYSPLSDDEDSAVELLEASRWKQASKVNHVRRHLTTIYIFLLHCVLLVYPLLAFRFRSSYTPIHEGFFTPTDAPIVYEESHIRTTFINQTFVDPWGGSTDEINDKWNSLLGVGIIKLTEEENSRLRHTPANLYGGKEGEYAGFLEVFHQLHCLNRLRKHYYDPDSRVNGDQADLATAELIAQHDSHCWDYLRQNIMCYSDVTILPIEFRDKQQDYHAGFDTIIPKTCRNFDAIYAWAKTRQTPYTPPGNEHVG